MAGKVDITGTGTATTISLSGDNATITAGAKEAHGILSLHDDSGGLWWGVLINAQGRTFALNKMFDSKEAQGAFPVVSFHGSNGHGGIGGNGQSGNVGVYHANITGTSIHGDFNKASIHLDGKNANIRLGGNGLDGDIGLFPASVTGDVTNDWSKASIHLDGDAGDIVLQNADCAEDFETIDCEPVDPGTVMVIGDDGRLRQSDGAYDKRVAGVISGAKELKPGIILGRKASTRPRRPVALVGQVYCKVDATYAPIEVGDLLTTSSTPGHAMRAIDPLKAFGAVIGKALSPLGVGRGLVRILVALQ
jgi:hypothetical protein